MITIDIQEAKKCNGEYSMYISFAYNSKLVDIVRDMPDRYWHSTRKVWEVPVKKFQTFVSQVTEFDIRITGFIDKIYPKKKLIITNIDGFTFKTEPFSHQLDGFRYGINHDRWLLADEQGLGKTKQVIDIAVAKKTSDCFNKCLIICGVNGLKWNWQNEIKTHSNETGHILGQRVNKRGKIVIGSIKDRLTDLDNLDKIDSYFIITNVESLRNEDLSNKIGELCNTGKISIVAIDEIHKCKNPTSQQGKGILKVQSSHRIAMTGTPLMNTPLDLYIILRWLGYERHSFYAFKNHYCVMGGFGGYEIVGYNHLDELQEQLSDIMLRRLKDEVLDLPEKLYVDEFVDMTTKQSQIYKEVLAAIQADIDKIALSPNPLAELIRLRQATGYTGILSSTIEESAKLDRMEELIEDVIANNRKVIVFSNWTQITTEVFERLDKYDTALITGDTKDEERQALVNKFQNDPNCKVIVGTIGAMGTGLTLTAASTVIFLDEPWNNALKEQAVDRCHRIGTKENVTIYTLLCKNTIDERIHDIVYTKGAISDALVDRKFDNNKDLINYLIS